MLILCTYFLREIPPLPPNIPIAAVEVWADSQVNHPLYFSYLLFALCYIIEYILPFLSIHVNISENNDNIYQVILFCSIYFLCGDRRKECENYERFSISQIFFEVKVSDNNSEKQNKTIS